MSDASAFGSMAEKTFKTVRAKVEKSDALKGTSAAMELISNTEATRPGNVIPVNCLPLEYILGQSGLPINRTISIQGPTASSKSSLFWFWTRLFLANGGFAAYFDLETKHDPQLAASYLGNPIAGQAKPPFGRLAIYRCGGPEAFVSMLHDFTDRMAKFYAKTGCTRPLIIGVDTLGTNVATSFGDKQRLQAEATPGFVFAQTAALMTATLSTWTQRYLASLPVMLVLLTQEKTKMETQETYNSGGRAANFSKSVGLSMRRIDKRKQLDESIPVLRIGQEKMSQNTTRNISLIVPGRCSYNEIGFREYSFDWAYALMQLLSEIPDTMLKDLGKVKRDTENKFSVTPAKGEGGQLLEKYKCSAAPYSDVGWSMLADRQLCAALRKCLRISDNKQHECPYHLDDMLDGRMWLSPDECGGEDVSGMDRQAIHARIGALLEELNIGSVSEGEDADDDE